MVGRFILVVASSIAITWLIGWFFQLSYPFWIAALLVWMFYPFIRFLRNKARFPNTLAVIVALLLGIGTLIGGITGIIFLIIFGVRKLSDFVPNWIEVTSIEVQRFFNEQILPIWRDITGAVDNLTPGQQSAVSDGISTLGARAADTLAAAGESLTEGLTRLLIIVPTSIVVILFVFISFYFIGKDWERIFTAFRKHTPNIVVQKSVEFKKMFQYRVLGFLQAQVILMVIASIVVLIGLLILRVENALTIAMIVGIAEILPYLGSGTILIPWFIYMLLTGNIGFAIGLAIVYAVTVLIRQAIEPKVLSSSMNLNTLAVLIALFVGFQLFGVIGVFLGPLLLVVLVIFKDIGVLGGLLDFIKNGFKDGVPTPKVQVKKK
ncbi:sporulation integral membrane protein YtvI [Paenalkalicoccus suaedae]|uniref:Sporulation integral membrane protein YtvI n=2 Tax=Paenalkalicoccus suaedae TaxID=2592382 RepID=A0A859FK44_9BACI|nr:sporulation integral membrane protein YtvI [Paenalkalicoccus suaedae]